MTMTEPELLTRLKITEPDGFALLASFQAGECQICLRLGLLRGYLVGDTAGGNGSIEAEVPNWDNLIAHLRNNRR